ncbi:ski2-like helicase, partial [Candidatus Woesearchaeota archaeon]|nr:ski2-like helicase [Candidatus Woesearchaeota archaeon]
LEKGVAFHHAGLHAKQRGLVEQAFRDKHVKAICATPTLAMGLDTPAFRVVVRDLKRYGGPWGMTSIPILEYEQQVGRAGRPGKDPWGEALCVAKDDKQAEEIVNHYLHGEPEAIYSKLAVEPVLRTYLLSLVASEFITTKKDLYEFFSRTFYAHQYGDTAKLNRILDDMTRLLREWEFLKPGSDEGPSMDDGFTTAADLTKKDNNDELLEATRMGRRVSELYLDPLTAHHLLKGMMRSTSRKPTTFSYLHLCAACLELRPYVKARAVDMDVIEEKLAVEEYGLLHLPPNRYTEEYDTYLDTVKTAMLLERWMEEDPEAELMERYNVRPGELHAKLELVDWIVYGAGELAKIAGFHEQRGMFLKLRKRLKHGAKEELLPLLKLRDVGRVRARKLYQNGIRDVGGVQRSDPTTLAQLVGKATALKLKERVGQNVNPDDIQVKPRKRKGQKALGDWG